ncbi:MAG: hypothetical protein NZ853_02800 [Leptospiraceae bacterium]|nr:hypothetical protein [Leptospiraceae bacterium]
MMISNSKLNTNNIKKPKKKKPYWFVQIVILLRSLIAYCVVSVDMH